MWRNRGDELQKRDVGDQREKGQEERKYQKTIRQKVRAIVERKNFSGMI